MPETSLSLTMSKKTVYTFLEYFIITDGVKNLYGNLFAGSLPASFGMDLIGEIITCILNLKNTCIAGHLSKHHICTFTISPEDFFYFECQMHVDPYVLEFVDKNGKVIDASYFNETE
jgi:hypothetical protein